MHFVNKKKEKQAKKKTLISSRVVHLDPDSRRKKPYQDVGPYKARKGEAPTMLALTTQQKVKAAEIALVTVLKDLH